MANAMRNAAAWDCDGATPVDGTDWPELLHPAVDPTVLAGSAGRVCPVAPVADDSTLPSAPTTVPTTGAGKLESAVHVGCEGAGDAGAGFGEVEPDPGSDSDGGEDRSDGGLASGDPSDDAADEFDESNEFNAGKLLLVESAALDAAFVAAGASAGAAAAGAVAAAGAGDDADAG